MLIQRVSSSCRFATDDGEHELKLLANGAYLLDGGLIILLFTAGDFRSGQCAFRVRRRSLSSQCDVIPVGRSPIPLNTPATEESIDLAAVPLGLKNEMFRSQRGLMTGLKMLGLTLSDEQLRPWFGVRTPELKKTEDRASLFEGRALKLLPLAAGMILLGGFGLILPSFGSQFELFVLFPKVVPGVLVFSGLALLLGTFAAVLVRGMKDRRKWKGTDA